MKKLLIISLLFGETLAQAATTRTPQPAIIPVSTRTTSVAPHPIFAYLDTYNTNSAKLTIPAPTAHAYTWNFSKINTYLPPLDSATPEQMNIITNYINNLSATDYKYLMLLAKMKATSAEYILTSYCQTWGNALNTTVPIVDILAWYLKAYPASTQTSAANITLEKNIHASVEPQDVVTSAVNWLKSWWSQ